MTDASSITVTCPNCGRELERKAYKVAGLMHWRTQMCECALAEQVEQATREATALAARKRALMIADVRKRCAGQIAEVYWMKSLESYVVTTRNAKAIEAARLFIAGITFRSLCDKLDQAGMPGDSRSMLAAATGNYEVAQTPRLLHVWGPPGVGKTRLAYAVGTEVFRAGYVVGFVNSSSLSTARKDADFWAWLLRDPRVVILDDLGKEIIGGFAREDFTSALYELTNAIYAASDRGLVQTTELDLPRLMDRYQSDALRWRWRELSAGGAPVKINKE